MSVFVIAVGVTALVAWEIAIARFALAHEVSFRRYVAGRFGWAASWYLGAQRPPMSHRTFTRLGRMALSRAATWSAPVVAGALLVRLFWHHPR